MKSCLSLVKSGRFNEIAMKSIMKSGGFNMKFALKSAVKSINDLHSEICNKVCSEICNEFNGILQNYFAFSKILLDFRKSFEIYGLQ